MTREAFIEVLKKEGYSYEMEGDKVVVTDRGDVYLFSLTSLPPDVEFRNRGDVDLRSLTSLPPDVEFRNRGWVYLGALTSLPPGVVFKNRGYVWLDYLLGGYFNRWSGNIEGIDSKRLLNKMIKDGLFKDDKRRV